MQRTTTVLVNGIPNQYNYGINTSEKKDDSITGTKYQAGAIPPSIPILYFVSITLKKKHTTLFDPSFKRARAVAGRPQT